MKKNPNHLFTTDELSKILGVNKHAIQNWLTKLNHDNWIIKVKKERTYTKYKINLETIKKLQ